MLIYSMPADHMYTLSSVPTDNINWGESAASAGKLCITGGCIPITLWTIGIIDSLWLFNRDGEAEERITIGVVPLTDHAMMVARNLLANHSRPPARTQSLNSISCRSFIDIAILAISSMLTHVSASRWMSLRMGGERASQVRLSLFRLTSTWA